ncbi:hypothetical protein EDD86DRAFT_268806 [Gorgonomyces haynaldii]|nr:hypothetical protein EDD86DRAFT_268806 [Gorgonomyces haynaldii]
MARCSAVSTNEDLESDSAHVKWKTRQAFQMLRSSDIFGVQPTDVSPRKIVDRNRSHIFDSEPLPQVSPRVNRMASDIFFKDNDYVPSPPEQRKRQTQSYVPEPVVLSTRVTNKNPLKSSVFEATVESPTKGSKRHYQTERKSDIFHLGPDEKPRTYEPRTEPEVKSASFLNIFGDAQIEEQKESFQEAYRVSGLSSSELNREHRGKRGVQQQVSQIFF